MKTLLDAISSGKIRINEELPPERELAENLGIGRGSLREVSLRAVETARSSSKARNILKRRSR